MVGIYLDRGCGMWIWAGLCGTAYQMAHVPQRLIKAAVSRVTEEFDPKPLGQYLRKAEEGEAPPIADAPPDSLATRSTAYAQPRKGLHDMQFEQFEMHDLRRRGDERFDDADAP